MWSSTRRNPASRRTPPRTDQQFDGIVGPHPRHHRTGVTPDEDRLGLAGTRRSHHGGGRRVHRRDLLDRCCLADLRGQPDRRRSARWTPPGRRLRLPRHCGTDRAVRDLPDHPGLPLSVRDRPSAVPPSRQLAGAALSAVGATVSDAGGAEPSDAVGAALSEPLVVAGVTVVWISRSTTAAMAGCVWPLCGSVCPGICTSTRLPSGTPTNPANGPPVATGSSCGPVPPDDGSPPGQVVPADSPVQVTAVYCTSTCPN